VMLKLIIEDSMSKFKKSRSEPVEGNLYGTIALMTRDSHLPFRFVTAAVSSPSSGNPLSKVD